jgi:hypothetical protein
MAQAIAIGIVFLILYGVIRLAARFVAGLTGTRHKAYRLIAARYGGKYESRGLVDPPTVSFAHSGASVRVGLAPVVPGQPASPRTRVVARFGKGIPFRLELMPISRPAPAQPPKGTRPVRSGHPDFDRGFVVQANDADMAREFLRPAEVRQAIEDLRKMAPPSGMLVSINPERILVQVDRNLGAQTILLDSAVKSALRLNEWLQTSVAARLAVGIEIVAAGPASIEDAGPPQCEVCGDPIDGLHVVCTSCKTPFHRDCWTFIGGCSTYGCASKHCVSA